MTSSSYYYVVSNIPGRGSFEIKLESSADQARIQRNRIISNAHARERTRLARIREHAHKIQNPAAISAKRGDGNAH